MRDIKVLESFKKHAEKKLKEMNLFRYLKKEEHIHHLDNNKSNNEEKQKRIALDQLERNRDMRLSVVPKMIERADIPSYGQNLFRN